MRDSLQQAKTSALTLAAFAGAVTFLLGSTWLATQQRIADNEAASKTRLLSQTLPAGSFDNNLSLSIRPLSPALQQAFGSKESLHYYTARKQQHISGFVFENTAPDGYGGRIKMLIGLLPDGRIHAVRVVQHQETPGLGDYIDLARHSWASQFQGKAAANLEQWQIRKDGGDVDYISGATISARAVTLAIGRTVVTFHRNRTRFLTQDTP